MMTLYHQLLMTYIKMVSNWTQMSVKGEDEFLIVMGVKKVHKKRFQTIIKNIE